MALRKLVPLLIAGMCQIGSAQSPTYGVGRTPTAEEIRAWDISISPTGKELPAGHGTAKDGAPLFMQKGCGGCHGRNGSMAQAPTLIKSDGTARNTFSCLSPCERQQRAGAALAVCDRAVGLHQPRDAVGKEQTPGPTRSTR